MFDTAFLDRDGTINVKAPEGCYITSPDELTLLPGAAQAIHRLNQQGIRVVVVTNQRGVARGIMTEADLQAVSARLDQLLAAENARLDATFACIHDRAQCHCRKPATGLYERAVESFPAIAAGRSVMVGDSDSDIAFANAIGMQAVRLQAHDAVAPTAAESRADYVARDLMAAVDWMLRLGNGAATVC